jgi:hypothetical protein
MFLGSYFNV